MRNNKIVPGVVLIALGVVFLLRTFGYVHFHWYNIWYLWPVFIVIAGVNLIFANNRSPWATGIKIFVILAGLGVLLFGNFDSKDRFWTRNFHFHNHMNDNDDDDDDDFDDRRGIVRIEGNSAFNEEFHADAKIARLSINGGAAEYVLRDTTNQLFQAFTKEHNGGYEFTHTSQDSVYTLNFNMKNGKLNWKGNNNNKVNFKLNSMPVWDIDLNMGATKLDFDLSPYKVRNMELNGGAGDFEIKLGQPLARTDISVKTGVSDVTISIPKGAACHIEAGTGLSSKDFEGFTKTNDDDYETPGFAAAKNKFYIEISGGLSGFKVNRY